jgi:hypothetical protein
MCCTFYYDHFFFFSPAMLQRQVSRYTRRVPGCKDNTESDMEHGDVHGEQLMTKRAIDLNSEKSSQSMTKGTHQELNVH